MQPQAATKSNHPLDAPVITAPRRCPKCDYELVGLRVGDRCPECATPIRGGKITFAETTMGSAPVSYLRGLALGANAFAYGFIAMLAAGLTGIARAVWNTLGAATPGDPPWPEAIVALVGALGVALGTMRVTRQRQLEAVGDEKLSAEFLYRRRAARVMAFGWLVAAGGALALVLAPLSSKAAAALLLTSGRPLLVIGLIVGIAGLIPLASWLRHLCEWAGDTALAERFKILILWMLVAALPTSLALLLTPTIGWGPMRTASGLFAWIIAGIAWLWIFLFFHWFASLCRWAVDNRIEMLAVDARRTERIAKRIEENKARQEREQAEQAAAAVKAKRGIELQAAMHPPEIPLAHDAPYELAPDDEPGPDTGQDAGEERRKSS